MNYPAGTSPSIIVMITLITTIITAVQTILLEYLRQKGGKSGKDQIANAVASKINHTTCTSCGAALVK